MFGRLTKRAREPIDFAGPALFRALWGTVLFVGLVRFVANGWVKIQYIEPTYFFKYDGFEWVFVPGPVGLYALFGTAAVCALMVAVGFHYRVAALGYALTFTWIQLLDVTNYLNHYYLVILLSCWFVILPLDRNYSVDAWRRRNAGRPMPTEGARLWLWLLRGQFTCVYVMAALAKAQPDWLFLGEPMGIWMRNRTELAIIGPVLELPFVPLLMSWGGFLYDLTIVGWLSWKRTRRAAFIVVLVFHGLTHVLFDIGLFPFLMTCGATLFFANDWPRRIFGRAPHAPPAPPVGRVWIIVVVVYLAVQAIVPLRHYALPGDVLWNEDGMRWSWKVMVREKNGSVTYHVKAKDRATPWQVSPFDYLTWRQANEMSGQPDLIIKLGRHIGHDFQRKGYDVEVRVEAWASLNGRKRALMLDPDVDLMRFDPPALPETSAF